LDGDLRSFNLREPKKAAIVICTSQVMAPLSQHARIRLVRALETRAADIPHVPIARCIRGTCEKVSLTNLCGQLVVTGVCRMRPCSRDQPLARLRPKRIESLSHLLHARVEGERTLSQGRKGSLPEYRGKILSSSTRAVWRQLWRLWM